MTEALATQPEPQTVRRYRGRRSYPIPVWNGILEHREKIGSAIWTFLLLLDRVEIERGGVGLVRGGRPIKIKAIADELHVDERTVRCDLDRLSGQGGTHRKRAVRSAPTLPRHQYIRCRRAPHGLVIDVLNSRKFGIWGPSSRSAQKCQSRGSDRQQSAERDRQQSADVSLYTQHKETQQKELRANKTSLSKPETTLWEFVGIKPCGSPEFRASMEFAWSSKNGHSALQVISEELNAFKAVHGENCFRGTARFFHALEKARADEKDEQPKPSKRDPLAVTDEEIPEWQDKRR